MTVLPFFVDSLPAACILIFDMKTKSFPPFYARCAVLFLVSAFAFACQSVSTRETPFVREKARETRKIAALCRESGLKVVSEDPWVGYVKFKKPLLADKNSEVIPPERALVREQILLVAREDPFCPEHAMVSITGYYTGR